MQANDQHLLEFLEQTQQLSIPLYQRKYSWTDKQCKQLLDDIIRVGSGDDRTHFLGAIVFKSYYERISKKIIIDGQQRITTLNLLISALSNYLYENPSDEIETDADELKDSYLFNPAKKGDLKNKLILTEDDQPTLTKIINNLGSNEKLEFDEAEINQVSKNYLFFKRRINEKNYIDIINGLQKLLIVYMELTDYDNPQLIFESMNSTGLGLNKSDLIRNYLLMGLDPESQKELYDNYWHKIELIFDKNKLSFDAFIKDYLTLKYDKVITSKDIYDVFKEYGEQYEVHDLVKDIYKYSDYFKKIVFFNSDDKKLNDAFKNLEQLRNTVVRPFILNLYRDYTENLLSAEDFTEMVKITESYLFRRFICELDTKSLQKTFAEMYSEIDKENHLESYQAILLNKEQYKRLPTDEEFRNSLLKRDIYNLKNNTKYFLGRLENYGSKEIVDILNDDIQIEHIMPQTLTKEWKEELGPDWKNTHDKYLHTLGNLTLTGYNPELSNKTFIEKRDMEGGFKDSPIRLNKDLKELDTWNENEIINRSEKLIKKSYEIWPYPQLNNDIIEKYKKETKKIKEEPAIKTSYGQYWTLLKEKLDKNPLFKKTLKISNRSYYDLPLPDIKFKTAQIVFRRTKDYVKCEIWMLDNAPLFNYLYKHKTELEEKTGLNYNWITREDKKSKKIEAVYEIDATDENNWETTTNWQINVAKIFYTIFADKIKEYIELNE